MFAPSDQGSGDGSDPELVPSTGETWRTPMITLLLAAFSWLLIIWAGAGLAIALGSRVRDG